MKRQIIAMGGGGFSAEPQNLALDVYLIQQTGKTNPKVCFIPTATGDSERYLISFYGAYRSLACEPSHLPFFARTPDVRETILSQDLIYVGGGNTKSMLAVWREWGLDAVLREAWEKGIVLSGISAGAICWFEQGVTDSYAGDLQVLDCLGMLPGSCCPHYDGELDRRPSFHAMLREKRIIPGYAVDDGVAIHFIDDKLHRVVSARPNAKAYQMRFADGMAHEDPLSPVPLSWG